jgi:hypothetical protein
MFGLFGSFGQSTVAQPIFESLSIANRAHADVLLLSVMSASTP